MFDIDVFFEELHKADEYLDGTIYEGDSRKVWVLGLNVFVSAVRSTVGGSYVVETGVPDCPYGRLFRIPIDRPDYINPDEWSLRVRVDGVLTPWRNVPRLAPSPLKKIKQLFQERWE